MALISLVCLLVLSSSALGRSTYGSFSSQSLVKPKINLAPTSSYSSYGNTQPSFDAPRPVAPTMTSNYGSSYGARPIETPLFNNNFGSALSAERSFPPVVQPLPATLPLSEADIACKGQRPDTVLPFGQGEKYIICSDDSKGDEIFCPKTLFWSAETRRCERKTSINENACANQPCLNGGQCFKTEYSYQCQCAPGFTGKTCELDATVCQTQQPCGQAYDSFCQSFHVGAALSHVCILRDGLAYGASAQQTHANPCQGVLGPHPLAFSNKGFLMCDGTQMFIQSCPGGTLWDDINKACVWPDMIGASSYQEQEAPAYSHSNYGAQIEAPRPVLNQVELPRVSSYGQQIETPRPVFNQVELPRASSYGQQIETPRPVFNQVELPRASSYGQQIETPRPVFNQVELPRASSYGQQIETPRPVFNQIERPLAPVMQKSYGY